MITDSIPWKHELRKMAAALERRSSVRRWTERTGFLVERDVMLGAYAIRKLMDTPGKISDEARSTSVRITRHQLIGIPPDFWSVYELWEHYELDTGSTQHLSLREFTNQIIHSFGWLLNADDTRRRLDGVFTCSDRQSKTSVIYLSLDVIVATFRLIADDDIVSLEMRRDEAGVMRMVKASRRASE